MRIKGARSSVKSMSSPLSFDPVWEEIYFRGQELNKYPFDHVVSFVWRHRPPKPVSETRILEIGCGAGNNLWFAAREGFEVAGIDASRSAISYARRRFFLEGLRADLRLGDYTSLPFSDGCFDLVFDRAAITCVGMSSARSAVSEVWRVLADGGKFLFNPYSTRHTSFMSGRRTDDNLVVDIKGGSLQGHGGICFYSERDMRALFKNGWKILSMRHTETRDEVDEVLGTVAEWRVIAQKTPAASK